MSATSETGVGVSTAAIEPDLQFSIEQFLYREAEIVDERRFEEWFELFTDDLEYEIPLRVTRESQASELDHSGSVIHDTKATLGIRVQRLGTEYAWAEQPPSRTRHYVSNVRVTPRESSNELDVRSNLLVYRNRGDATSYDLYSADRRDILRAQDGEWRIARRYVVLDQSSIAGNSLSIFF